MQQLYNKIYELYQKGQYRKKILKNDKIDKFFTTSTKPFFLRKEEYQNEIEKYIIYLWSLIHNKKCDFSYVIEVNVDSSILNNITFDELLQFISPQTEIVKLISDVPITSFKPLIPLVPPISTFKPLIPLVPNTRLKSL